jgi:hypothetical protein
MVASLHEKHRRTAFPRRLTGEEINGMEMVSLSSTVAGCVDTWLARGSRIDDWRWDVLADCEQRLNRAIPALDGEEAAYYQCLLDMTVLILENPDDSRPG